MMYLFIFYENYRINKLSIQYKRKAHGKTRKKQPDIVLCHNTVPSYLTLLKHNKRINNKN